MKTIRMVALAAALMVFLVGVPAQGKKETKNGGAALTKEDYINNTHYGSISVKTAYGIAVGSYGSGFLYFPGGVKESMERYERGFVYLNDVLDQISDEFAPSDPFFEEPVREMYYHNGTLYFLTCLGDPRYNFILWDFNEEEQLEKISANPKQQPNKKYFMYFAGMEEYVIEELVDGSYSGSFLNANYVAYNICFIGNKMYYTLRAPFRLYEMDLDTKEIKLIYRNQEINSGWDLRTDGERLYFYTSTYEADNSISYKSYIYDPQKIKLTLNTRALPVYFDYVDELDLLLPSFYYKTYSDFASMSIVKLNSTQNGWDKIEEYWERMSCWYLYEGELYCQIDAESGKEAFWYAIDLKTGKLRKTTMKSMYNEGEVINTIDGQRVIMSVNRTEITNLEDPEETYLFEWGFVDYDLYGSPSDK